MAVALLVAAGSGERLGHPVPKAFVVVAGRPLHEWVLDALRAAPGVSEVVAAVPAGWEVDGARCVVGGATRSHSVREAARLAPDADAYVVCDAARPFTTPALVQACLDALEDAECAVAAAPVTDTVKQAGADGWVTGTLDRSLLWAIQTPQAFRGDALRAALDQDDAVLAAATDDASLVEQAGGRVRVVASGAANFKVTTPHDLRVAELLLGGSAAAGQGGRAST